MKTRFSLVNNPYAWVITAVLGLIGVSQWPSPEPIQLDSPAWEEGSEVASDELSDFLRSQGWMDAPRPGEGTRLRRFSESSLARHAVSIARSKKSSGSYPGTPPVRDQQIEGESYPEREMLQP